MVNARTRSIALLVLTFVVSFCSFAYEFVYSELLTVMYGGTVTQYVVTVGLYFFSLGIGAGLSDDLNTDEHGRNFFRTELLLAASAPAGVLLIIALNSVWIPQGVPPELIWVVARLPIVVVGFLSGFELPLLTQMVDNVADERTASSPWSGVRRLGSTAHGWCVAFLSVFWATERTVGSRSGLSVVLAMDYIGGLVGAVVYATVLYPGLGLIPTIFVLALLNGVAALAFVGLFGDWSQGRLTRLFPTKLSPPAGTDRALVTRVSTTLIVVCLLLSTSYAGVLANHNTVEDELSEFYLEQGIENDYPPGAMAAEITSQEMTEYQHVIRYKRTWIGAGPNPHFTGRTERCLRLGSAVQMCESWADSYHNGLVDVPMSIYEHSPETKVLVIGGGDWVAIDHLREYNVTIDHVDIDGQFMNQSKNDPFFRQWHNDSYTYDRLQSTTADGYQYLQRSNETYDLVLLDVPGATDKELLRLYSKEFYRSIRRHLTESGTMVTWGYSPNGYPEHHKTFMNTVRAGGFTRQLPYWAYEDIDSDGDTERIEKFYMFSPGERRHLPVENGTAYVRKHREEYQDHRWQPLPLYRGVRVNSIFHPNYDILINT